MSSQQYIVAKNGTLQKPNFAAVVPCLFIPGGTTEQQFFYLCITKNPNTRATKDFTK